MDPSRRVVTRIPMTELWIEGVPAHATRGGTLGEAEVVALLAEGRASFVVASVGEPLRCIAAADRYDFWKTEVKKRLVQRDAQRFRLEEFPGSYCYVASKWEGHDGSCLVLLEKHH